MAKPGGMMPLSRVPDGIPPTWPLGVLGITGLTADFGLLDLGEPKPGQTVVVSGAAGSVAGQIAKLKGCRVVGIAGGPDKCKWLTDEAHFDAAIDYKSEDIGARPSQHHEPRDPAGPDGGFHRARLPPALWRGLQ